MIATRSELRAEQDRAFSLLEPSHCAWAFLASAPRGDKLARAHAGSITYRLLSRMFLLSHIEPPQVFGILDRIRPLVLSSRLASISKRLMTPSIGLTKISLRNLELAVKEAGPRAGQLQHGRVSVGIIGGKPL